MFEQNGRIALVTGAGRGIGQAIAEALGSQGARVAVNDLHAERAEAAASELLAKGIESVAVAGDVTKPDVVAEIVERATSALGPIDVLVNNAGIPEEFPLKQFRDTSPEDWDKFLRLNLYGVLHCVHAVIDGMCDRGWGRVVTISSEAWRMGVPMGISMYGAGKAGALGFMRHLSSEIGPYGVTANSVSLGEMNNLPATPEMLERYPTRRLGKPEDVAAAVVYLASDEACWVTGQVLPVNGGLVTI